MRRFGKVYHVDAYRLKKLSELVKLGFAEILKDSGNIVLIEWADKVRRLLPKSTVWLKFRHGKQENERTIEIQKFKSQNHKSKLKKF